MSPRCVLACFLAALPAAHAADTASADPKPPEAKQLTPAEAAKARLRAEGRKTPAPKAAPSANAADAAKSSDARDGVPNGDKKNAPNDEKQADPNPTVLPKVEVRNSRITELDQQIAKQEREIARQKENTKSTETDKALNDPKISKLLSIFGGESSKHREAIAQERVSLMEAEKDILEAMKTARTREERAELQKQLDELKAYRRELEKSLR